MLEIFNTVMSLLFSLLAGLAVMSPRVRDGIIIKTGLVLISLGFLFSFFLELDRAGSQPLAKAHVLVQLGVLVGAVGYLVRQRKHGKKRRLTDFLK